jgi:hypothetical protein
MAEKVCGAWRFPRHKIELFIVNLFRLALFELCSRLCQNNSLLYHETRFYWTHPEILLFGVQPKGDRRKVQKIRKEPSFKRKIDKKIHREGGNKTDFSKGFLHKSN